uniref:Small-subunit processome Utp12 domain-containing protein n=2 Tax=Pseudo-nitzschia australis TaxID=44445 RepID=A0A7S4AGE9_9STRA|mmetsp:Transcript_12001/g.23865  ORF Transcript_12001/g.23865 Transcript_12001/m.23865 type:complete len:986 (+) Transcript_12001:190-3147(+)
MKFNYKLQRLCGAYYGNPSITDSFGSSTGRGNNGSNIVYTTDGNTLISPVSNRIQVIDLRTHTVRTLAVEARSNVRCIALSPNDTVLVVVDVNNYATIVNIVRGVVLHRFRFKRKVVDAKFSPCGSYLAVTHGKHVQVWLAPNHLRKEFAPLVLHRTYTGQSGDTTHVEWSEDSSVILATSKDCTVRIWTVHTTRRFQPVTLSGHKTPVVGAYFDYKEVEDTDANSNRNNNGIGIGIGIGAKKRRRRVIDSVYTMSQDGALVTWKCNNNDDDNNNDSSPPKEDIDLPPNDDGDDNDNDNDNNTDNNYDDGGDFEAQVDEAVDFFSGGAATTSPSPTTFIKSTTPFSKSDQAHHLVNRTWKYGSRHYFNQTGSSLVACTYNPQSKLLAVGFSSGIFGIYEMPTVANIHTLSVGSNQVINTCVLNTTGEWLALGCPRSRQLLVWEWRSETYVLKQRGHAYGMNSMAYSPDGVVICTGGEDGKIKLWNASSGFCYVTLEESHNAPVSAVVFANSSVVLSAGLDGTVRAHDLHRYKTFRTFTTPTPVQFLSLAVDPAGEIVAAGSMDPFHVYAWSLQTGKLLDVYTGHTGPISQLAFPPSNGGVLASASWDGSVKLWDLYKNNVSTESLQHNSDVVCVACRPDGREIVSGTIRGMLSFWDVESGKLKYELDGRRDIAGGRKQNDRMTSDNNASARYFTSVCYSADGTCVLAGGNSKYVCIYECSQQILLKKFQVTFNRNLDGVLDKLNSKKMTDFGPTDEHAGDSEDETTYNALRLPGAKRGDDGSRSSKVEVLTKQVSFSSTGREWATVSGEGLHVYSLDEDMLFDPISLTEAITPSAVEKKLEQKSYSMALRMALHLNEDALIKQVLEEIPYAAIATVVRTIGPEQLEKLMNSIGKVMETSPHVQYYLSWCLEMLKTHGVHMDKRRSTFMRAFRSVHKVVQTKHDELKTICNQNRYTLDFIESQASLTKTARDKEDEAKSKSNAIVS